MDYSHQITKNCRNRSKVIFYQTMYSKSSNLMRNSRFRDFRMTSTGSRHYCCIHLCLPWPCCFGQTLGFLLVQQPLRIVPCTFRHVSSGFLIQKASSNLLCMSSFHLYCERKKSQIKLQLKCNLQVINSLQNKLVIMLLNRTISCSLFGITLKYI